MAEFHLGQEVRIIDHMVRISSLSTNLLLEELKGLWPDYPTDREVQPGYRDNGLSRPIRMWAPRSLLEYMKDENLYFTLAHHKRNAIPDKVPAEGIVTKARTLTNGFLFPPDEGGRGYFQAETVTRGYEVTYSLRRRPIVVAHNQITTEGVSS